MILTLCSSIPSPRSISKDQPVILVGGKGKVGKAFSTLLGGSPSTIIVNRNQNLTQIVETTPENTPLLVCTTNDALPHVISATPTARRNDLIFLQNGMLLPELSQFNLQDCTTQVLLYLAAGANGSFVDGKQTVCIGKWAEWFSKDVLQQNNLQCRVVFDKNEYKILLVHKLLWACIFWMMSAALEGASVGEIVEKHRGDVEELVAELVAVLGKGEKIDSSAALDAVIAYSLSIPDAVPSKEMALKEFRWRNGWVLAKQRELVDGCRIEQKLHIEWLRRAGVGDLIDK